MYSPKNKLLRSLETGGRSRCTDLWCRFSTQSTVAGHRHPVSFLALVFSLLVLEVANAQENPEDITVDKTCALYMCPLLGMSMFADRTCRDAWNESLERRAKFWEMKTPWEDYKNCLSPDSDPNAQAMQRSYSKIIMTTDPNHPLGVIIESGECEKNLSGPSLDVKEGECMVTLMTYTTFLYGERMGVLVHVNQETGATYLQDPVTMVARRDIEGYSPDIMETVEAYNHSMALPVTTVQDQPSQAIARSQPSSVNIQQSANSPSLEQAVQESQPIQTTSGMSLNFNGGDLGSVFGGSLRYSATGGNLTTSGGVLTQIHPSGSTQRHHAAANINVGNSKTVVLEQSIMFGSGFQCKICKAGFGLAGGSDLSTGRTVSGGSTATTGYTVRPFFKANSGNGRVQAGIYLYSANRNNGGNGGFGQEIILAEIDSGSYYNYRQELTLNDNGKSNGSLSVFIDGRQVLNKTGIMWMTGKPVVEQVLYSSMHGGAATSAYAAKKTETIKIKKVKVGWGG